jgi:hypothetical protein
MEEPRPTGPNILFVATRCATRPDQAARRRLTSRPWPTAMPAATPSVQTTTADGLPAAVQHEVLAVTPQQLRRLAQLADEAADFFPQVVGRVVGQFRQVLELVCAHVGHLLVGWC